MHEAYGVKDVSSSDVTPIEPSPERRTFKGWRKGVTTGASVAALVLLLNLLATIAFVVHFGIHNGVVTLYQGGCNRVSTVNLVIHLVINVLGTLLLAASNYCMQVLSAPTRADVDRAHVSRKWLDIGISSYRNLGKIGKWRLSIWILLAVSSLPLHLVYNSVAFSTIAAYEYTGLVVSPAFLNSTTYNEQKFETWLTDEVIGITITLADIQAVQAAIPQMERLSTAECQTEYHQALVTTRSDLVLVSSFGNVTDDISTMYLAFGDGDFYLDFEGAASWICDTYNSTAFDGCLAGGGILPDPRYWSIQNHPIDYCLSRTVPENCKIKSSMYLMAIVVICNVGKLIGLLVTLWKHSEEPLVTMGDAVFSFLLRSDISTEDACLLSKNDVTSGKYWRESTHTKPWTPKTLFRLQAVSARRWWLSIALLALGLITVGLFVYLAIHGLTQGDNLNGSNQTPSFSAIWALGFGLGNGAAFWANAPRNLYGNIILANLPQLIFSMLYFVYNGLYTVMSHVQEWSSYPQHRKGLRVSRPQGQQRSTYYLQLPYKYAIPLIVASGAMHWLISQSFFLLAVDFVGTARSTDVGSSFVTCGYSAAAIIVALLFGFLMVLCVFINGFRRTRFEIPPVGSCSLAIAAACHARGEVDPKMPLMWGVVKESVGVEEPGHCSFSDGDVGRPFEQGLYRKTSNPVVFTDVILTICCFKQYIRSWCSCCLSTFEKLSKEKARNMNLARYVQHPHGFL